VTGFTVTNAKRPKHKNTLIGSFDLQMPSGLVVRGAMLLGAIDEDAIYLATGALAAEREARHGDDLVALCGAIKTARALVIRMAQALAEIEA